MKKSGTGQVFIVIALIIAIPVCSAFFYYYSLSIADFFSSSKFEAPDELSLQLFVDNKWNVFGSNGFQVSFFLDSDIFAQPHNTSPQISSLDMITSILRC
jgi:hypothetical protein